MVLLNENFYVPWPRELIKMIINRDTWKVKTPLEKWSYLYGLGRAIAELLKYTIYSDNQTLCWFSYFPLFYTFTYIVLMFNTVFYYTYHGEVFKSFPCTCVLVGPILSVYLLVSNNYIKFLMFALQFCI